HDRHAVLLHQLTRFFERRDDFFRLEYPDRLATQAFHDSHVVHTIPHQVRRIDVDVVEGQLDTVIHVETALGLTDQAQVGVVDQHVDVRQFELRAYCQFLDHELEVVITRNRHDIAGGVGATHAQ